MKAGTLLLIIHDVIDVMRELSLIDANGDIVAPDAARDALIAQRVETILKNYGVSIPDTVDKVIQIIPLVLALAGVK